MKLHIKRAYDKASDKDGYRVLVDRLWPRGVSKAHAHIDLWAKDVTPSAKLRSWYHAGKKTRFLDFTKKYSVELTTGAGLKELKKILKTKKVVTLVTGVKDMEHSHIPTLVRRLSK